MPSICGGYSNGERRRRYRGNMADRRLAARGDAAVLFQHFGHPASAGPAQASREPAQRARIRALVLRGWRSPRSPDALERHPERRR